VAMLELSRTKTHVSGWSDRTLFYGGSSGRRATFRGHGYGTVIALSLSVALACGDPTSAPIIATAAVGAPLTSASPGGGATKVREAGASVGWNQVARDYVSGLTV